MNRRMALPMLIVTLWMLASCVPGQQSQPTASPVPTSTPEPTDTPTPIPTPTPTPTPNPTLVVAPRDLEYEDLPGAYLGIYYDPYFADLAFYESTGKQPAIMAFYPRWGDPFNTTFLNANAQLGQVTMATWEYNVAPEGSLKSYEGRLLDAILDGRYDNYIRKWAEGARDFGRPVLLRWGHEMNGDWSPWSGAENGGGTLDGFGDPDLPDGPERFVAAYQHIHDIFDQVGAANVSWVWCPSTPAHWLGDWSKISNYYPGDDYVDWLCIDGYNWGRCEYGAAFNSRWVSFDEVFAQGYAELQAINSRKPIMLGEYASTEIGGDKAAWILDAHERIQKDYPQIRAAVWFHGEKETDWRINSSPESLEAFRQAVASDYWLETWPDMK